MQKRTSSYIKGLCWFLLSIVIGCINDSITKYIASTPNHALHFWQITFLRLTSGIFFLIPFAQQKKKNKWNLNNKIPHMLRGGLFVAASALWAYGLKHANLTTATIISFTIPLFVLLFSAFFLREHITIRLFLFTLIGFLGVFIILYPQGHQGKWQLDIYALAFTTAASLFALLDVANKYYAQQGTIINLILYPSLVAASLSFPFAYYHWQTPHLHQIVLLCSLGLLGNLIIYCLLKAYRNTSLISLAPIRYTELLLSICISTVIFKEETKTELWGAALIIPAILLVVYDSKKND